MGAAGLLAGRVLVFVVVSVGRGYSILFQKGRRALNNRGRLSEN